MDQTFQDQIALPVNNNYNSFAQFSSTSALYLPGGQAPAVGSTFRNPDLAATYRLIADEGTRVFYHGEVGRDLVNTVQHPPRVEKPAVPWPYPAQALHRYLEASALAFADRNRYIGDYTRRALLEELLSDGFAKERAACIDPAQALTKPVPAGVPDGSYGDSCTPATAPGQANTQGTHTTNLTVSDRWGNVVEYTLTIEQTGGNAMVVPGRGFLLNNELTDFNFKNTQLPFADPNLPAPGKRPRSSMSPTIVLSDGRPYLAVGTPGGSTIITTVLQILVNRIDFGMTLPQAIAAPRATQRNTTAVQAEQAFLDLPETAVLRQFGHTFTLNPEIGAATGIEFRPDGRVLAAAEPVRRGGGAAAVVHPCC